MCLSALLVAAPLSAPAQTTSSDDVTVHVAGASRAVQAYSPHSVEDLRYAISEMLTAGNLHALKPDTFIAQRRTIVRGWAKVFKAIEDSYDPTYDANDPGTLPGSHRPDPRDIPDPRREQPRPRAAGRAVKAGPRVLLALDGASTYPRRGTANRRNSGRISSGRAPLVAWRTCRFRCITTIK